jgi:transgelin
MASVSSLDSDMRKLRMDGNTLDARKEVRIFIEEALGERLGVSKDDSKTELFERLKDGVALCK